MLVLAAGCDPQSASRRHSASFHVFGTIATLDVRTPTAAKAATAQAAAAALLMRRHRQWHAWERSELTALNERLARGIGAEIPPALAPLFDASVPLVKASEGAFDPAAGALVALWGFHTSDYPPSGPPPTADVIAAWRASHRRLDELIVSRGRIAAGAPVQFDFNAIAEGVASAEVMALLSAEGIDHALLDLGGDISARGDAGGRPWRVALRDPIVDGALAWVDLRDGESLFASGGYAKYRSDSQRRRPHILDPRNGHPTEAALASAVLARDAARADATATALMVVGAEGMDALLPRMGVSCALVVDTTGAVHVTGGLATRLRGLRGDRPLRVHDRKNARCD